MSHQAGRAALSLELPKALKLLLYDLAIRACPHCGLTWPGVPNLLRSTGMGESALRETIGALAERGLLVIHRYPTGGRGRATEYVVLPNHTDLSPAPCGECASRMKTLHRAKGMTTSGQQNPPQGGGYSPIPSKKRPQNPPQGGPQQEVQQQQEGALSRAADPPASPPGRAATPPASDHTASSQAVAEVTRMVSEARAMPKPDRPSHSEVR